MPKYSKRLNVKLVIVSNDMPRFHDKTNAFWSRLVVIPFAVEQKGDKSIEGIIDELRPEFGGIIKWAFRAGKRTEEQRLPQQGVRTITNGLGIAAGKQGEQ